LTHGVVPLHGYWTTHGYANLQIANSQTGQVADTDYVDIK